ncbi:MAG: hypothetical protein R6X12_02155 [bacterium]
MKTRVIAVLIITAALAMAQGGDEARNAQAELEKTDQLIERAEPVIVEAANPEATSLLVGAKDLQRDAWRQFRERRWRQARNGTMQARVRVRKAIELVEVDPEKVAEEIRLAAELVSEAGPVIRGSGIRAAEEMLRLAEGELETARRYLGERRYALALRFARAARLHVREGLAKVRRRGGWERVRFELDRTDELLARAREEIGRSSGRSPIRELLARAEALQLQAREAEGKGHLEQALRLSLASRNLLLRAWERAKGEADPELAEAAAADNDRLIAEWQDIVTSEGSEESRRLFARAMELQVRVRVRVTAGEYGPAYREANQVRRMLNRAIESLRTAPDGDRD